MSGLADSIWANAPSTPSASAGQGNSNKSPRESKDTKSAPPRNATTNPATRKRGRGGAKPKQTIDTNDTNPSKVTEAPAISSTNPSSATSSRPAPPARTQSTQSMGGGRKPPSGTLPPKATLTATPNPPAPQASSAAPSKRIASRKRGQTKRKGSLAISVVSNSSEQPPSTIIEPATPLSSTESPVSSIPPTLHAINTSNILTNTALAPRTPSPISSQAETLPPATPETNASQSSTIESLKPASVAAVLLNQSTTLRPSTPASHLDWADDDEEELPDLDDWGVTPTTGGIKDEGHLHVQQSTIIVAPPSPLSDTKGHESEDEDNQSVISVPASTVSASVKGRGPRSRGPLTDEQLAEKKRIAKEKQKAARQRKASARISTGDLASRIGGLAITETLNSSLPARPASVASNSSKNRTSPLSTNNLPLRPQNHRTNSRPATPSSSSPPDSSSGPNPSSNPRRQPFGGQSTFSSPNRERAAPGSGGLAADRKRDRPTSSSSAASGSVPHARPVISANALSQLTKSLSGGTRAHGNTTASGAARTQVTSVAAE